MATNFPINYASSVLALSITLPVIDIIAVGLRFHVRQKQKSRLEADDWLCLAALVNI